MFPGLNTYFDKKLCLKIKLEPRKGPFKYLALSLSNLNLIIVYESKFYLKKERKFYLQEANPEKLIFENKKLFLKL